MRIHQTIIIVSISAIIVISGMGCISSKYNSDKKVTFNRLSLLVPKGWNYSTNPQAKPGSDQIQLYSPDRNRTLLITLTDARSDINLTEVTLQSGRELAMRAASIPEFSDCLVEGSGQETTLWGRNGIVTTFELYKDTTTEKKKHIMKIYNFGESLNETHEVLFIGAFIIGKENDDIEKIVKSMVFLAKSGKK